jgi:hypothetical protein
VAEIFRVQREYGRLASGSEDVNPENLGHRRSTVVFFCEISPSENHPSHSSSCEMESRRKSLVVVLGVWKITPQPRRLFSEERGEGSRPCLKEMPTLSNIN